MQARRILPWLSLCSTLHCSNWQSHERCDGLRGNVSSTQNFAIFLPVCRVYGSHELAPVASINFTVKFSQGKNIGNICNRLTLTRLVVYAVEAAATRPSFRRRQTREQTNRRTDNEMNNVIAKSACFAAAASIVTRHTIVEFGGRPPHCSF